MLDPNQGYVLAGERDHYAQVTRSGNKPERVLHLRLSAEALEQLTREGVKISLGSIDDSNTVSVKLSIPLKLMLMIDCIFADLDNQ